MKLRKLRKQVQRKLKMSSTLFGLSVAFKNAYFDALTAMHRESIEKRMAALSQHVQVPIHYL